MLYSFADLVIDIHFHYDFGRMLCERYLYHGDREPDFSVEVTPEMLEFEREYAIPEATDGCLESIAAYRYICQRAYDYGCMFMHCSAISYKGNCILFTAPSGTGKSTHARLWRRKFGEDVISVNDDKPLLRIFDDTIYACGTPWDGKHRVSNNIKVPVKAVVVLAQAPQNNIAPLTKQQFLYHILNQTLRPEDPKMMGQTLDFCEKMVQTIPAFRLECNISEEAVMKVYDALKEYFDED